MEYSLVLTFICADGKKSNLTIDGVKPDLSEEKIQEVMDTIITNNIFFTKNGDYIQKDNAAIIQTTTTNYSFS